MLRESANAQNQPVDIVAVTKPTLDPLLPNGREIIAFVDAIALTDFDELPEARQDLMDTAGPGAVLRAAAVCAGFEGTNRVVDAVGVTVNKRYYDIGDELGVTVPDHLR
ncbi:MAG: hypothetical protein HKN94_10520 [Acidimicrobiales bacterium]|nr:hypothetical protein [Acidimicrobiales bacterium]RZV48129.1 MAG: hypothetical protein EX269_02780 [Acidimicrobiales bacterium]